MEAYMKTETLKSNLSLLLTAFIWGVSFVAQRAGMDYVGPFTFNAVRFALGAFSIVPLIILLNRNKSQNNKNSGSNPKNTIKTGLIAGLFLFFGSSLQQVGIVYTTASKAAFITGLYIVIVPILGIFLKQRMNVGSWLGAIMAVIGLFLLSVSEKFTISFGDLLVLIGAFFWAVHILLIDRFSIKVDALKLAFLQFITCSVLSLVTALLTENIMISNLQQAITPILYGGIFSVGIAYTLQIIGQKNARPSHAAIILSLETVFAAIGGFLILNERMGTREILGCLLMLAGMLSSQLLNIDLKKDKSNKLRDKLNKTTTV
jgi:drug/metabolite transporter (DMT)-like permease